MRLANRVLFCALAIFILSVVSVGQTLRPSDDPRNQSPSVGTGGPEGGPTGLFTIYDGDTIRRGEFTFSIAYSNYDRDPGNVDITEVPLSFNIGLNDHIELFIKSTGYRGVKVNNPKNLSSFYLPNSQLFFSGTQLCVPGAIVLAPSGPNVGNIAGTSLFRPPCAQPFVQFPFTGGTTFLSFPPNGIGSTGFPGFSAQLGPPVGGGTGAFGSAAFFPGIGSPSGSILPGVVLATGVLPATALTNPITIPVSFTTDPAYLPDAPFINRLYGQTSFTNIVVGAKIRFTGPNNPLGAGIIPFWRWWLDKPNDFGGFNQMQRGAGPGAKIGDFGLIGFVAGRLTKHVEVSANGGVILDSNPRTDAMGGGTIVLLDRPNELIAGVGFDFPINKHFQPIAELKSVQYWGKRTPNAFPQNPVDALGGVKIYPRRWFGFGAWYRINLNQQSAGHFKTSAVTSINVTQLSGVNVPGRGVVIVPGTTVTGTTGNGVPAGFNFSDDPHGFGFQFFAGHRNRREPTVLPNQPPVISSFTASKSTVTLPCPPGTRSDNCPATAETGVTLTTVATDPDGDTLLYSYNVTGGRITGEGASVSWDLSGLGPGTYTATVDVDDGCGCITSQSTTVTIAGCTDCKPILVCPTVAVDCPSEVDEGGTITVTARFTQGTPEVTPTYNWTVSAGTITSGQGTSSITVSTNGLGGQSVTATVDVSGADPSCPHTASCTTPVKPRAVPPRKFDTYGNIRFNDEKARLDNFAIQLQNEPSAQGYIIAYGSCDAEGQTRANRAKDYLVNTRGIDASRIVVVDGGCMPELRVDLWIVPQGATPPAADTAGAVSPCPDCKKPTRRRGGRRGRGEEE